MRAAAAAAAEYRRAANLAANNGKERKDLYTDNWDGSEYKGKGRRRWRGFMYDGAGA